MECGRAAGAKAKRCESAWRIGHKVTPMHTDMQDGTRCAQREATGPSKPSGELLTLYSPATFQASCIVLVQRVTCSPM